MNDLIAILDEFDRAGSLAKSLSLSKPFRRPIYASLARDLVGFVSSVKPSLFWIIMSGLRGVGKTTLLAQLYNHPSLAAERHKFYLSLDSPVGRKIDYSDLADVLEARMGCRLHHFDGKLFLFLDEIHFWSGNWSLDLKVLYDSFQPNGGLFLVCTGSSALQLSLNPDTGRRVNRIVKIPPLSLSESLLLEAQTKQRQLENQPGQEAVINHLEKISHQFDGHLKSDRPQAIRQALFESKTAQEAGHRLVEIEPSIGSYWSVFGQNEDNFDLASTLIEAYINLYLTLPYIVDSRHNLLPPDLATNEADYYFNPNQNLKLATAEMLFGYESQIKKQIESTLGVVLERDLKTIKKLGEGTLAATPNLLRLLADSDTISLQKINQNLAAGKKLSLAINTIQGLLKILCQAEILYEVQPLGSAFGRTTKPSKYLFAAPALRAAILPLDLVGSRGSLDSYASQKQQFLKGRLLEDTVGMYLKHLFSDQPLPRQIEYDAKSGGADFLISRVVDGRREVIVVEAGWQKDSHRQLNQTRKRLRSSPYGLVITNKVKEVQVYPKSNTAYIPLTTFLLM